MVICIVGVKEVFINPTEQEDTSLDIYNIMDQLLSEAMDTKVNKMQMWCFEYVQSSWWRRYRLV